MLTLCGEPWFPITKLLQPTKNTIIYVDSYILPTDNTINHIFVYQEPYVISDFRQFLLNNWSKYTYILTYDDSLLHLPNARKFVPSSTFITAEDANSINIDSKKFQISSLTGLKSATAGHRFRLAILTRKNNFKGVPIQSTFFRSNVAPMTWKLSDKIHLFREFQFSLVIENTRQNNCFTEKLCDCLYTKTIPVYYGAPNIHEYFDTTGWIILENESVDELLNKIRTLDETWYTRHLDTVMTNYNTVLKYISYEDNINSTLETLDY